VPEKSSQSTAHTQIALFQMSVIGYNWRQMERMLAMTNGFDSPAAMWLLVSLQACGLAIACAARVFEGCRHQSIIQNLFLVVLALTGATNVATFAVGPGWWLTSSTTLALMILIATWDVRSGRESATW
jgi:hypothetical protein